jgi:CHAT domain-containing protein/tetratricopeptide (TPR) repeat protein
MRTARYLSVLGLGALSVLSVAQAGTHNDLARHDAVVPLASQKGTPAASRLIHDELRRQAEGLVKRAVALSKIQNKTSLTAAVALFNQSAPLFLSLGLADNAANSHLRAGEIYVTFGNYAKARRSFGNAQALTQNPELRCRALTAMTRLYASTGPIPLAQRYSEQTVSACKSLGPQAQAEALEAQGEALQSAEENAASQECFRRALDLFTGSQDDNGRARALLMMAYSTFFADGQHDQGLLQAKQAMQLWSAIGDQYGIARTRSALGIFAITRGEFETAECNYQLAKDLFHRVGDRDDEASVLNGLGYVNREVGNWQESLELYQTARATFASVQDLLGEHEAITSVGRAFSAMGNYSQMLAAYQVGLRLARQAKAPVLEAASLADIGEAYAAVGNYAQAEVSYRQALRGYRAVNHIYGEGDVLIRIGRLQSRQKMYSQAIASLEQANKLKEKTGQIEDIAKIQYELAWIFRRLNRLDEALAAIEKTIDIIESQRITLSKFDARAVYFAAVHRYYALYIQILMLLHRRDSDPSLVTKAFEASERSKVRSLLDLLNASSQSVTCDERLRKQLEVLDNADAEKTGIAIGTMPLEQIQTEIDAQDTVLLEYSLGDEKSYVWSIRNSGIAVHELPSADTIRKLVDGLRRTIVPPQHQDGESGLAFEERRHRREEAYGAYARELSRLLLGPVPLGFAKHILVVPDGALQYIPFVALPLPQSGSGLLIQRYEVDVLPSASVLGTLRRTTSNRAPPSATAIIFADPVFESSDPRISGMSAINAHSKPEKSAPLTWAIRDIRGSSYISRLPASRDEATAIAKILQSGDPQAVRLEMDFAASRDTVLKDGLSHYRMIHFATHGVINGRRPEMSALILSLLDRKGRKIDGYLRLGDIYKLKLSADLVVLSSCDSALGKDLESEGTIGLPRGFLYAGAKRVIASLWKVDDTATAKLMSSLYARIQQGESPSAALRKAQLEMLGDPLWSKHYYWAAFTLQGEYQ